MSQIINEFSLISKLNNEFKINVCLFYIFQNACVNSKTNDIVWKGYNVFIKLSDEKVFGYGENSNGQLGLGHANSVILPTQIVELSNCDIAQFSNGLKHCVALNIYGQIFQWGENELDKFYLTPKIVNGLENEFVISACCGFSHTIALTKSGEVFAWGNNKWGQIGINYTKAVTTPIKVEGFTKEHVNYIACGSFHSLALTKNNNVYSWGLNSSGQLANSNRKNSKSIIRVKIMDYKYNYAKEVQIKKIACGKNHSVILSLDGDVYICGGQCFESKKIQNPKLIIKLESKFTDIGAHHLYDISTILTNNGYYQIWGGEDQNILTAEENKFETIINVFKYYFSITYRAINLQTLNHMRNNGKYKKEFIEQQLISNAGSFSKVYISMSKIDSKIYAIKKLALEENQIDVIFKELQLMNKMKSGYFVKYFNTWIENNYNFDEDSTTNNELSNPIEPFLLHIQMEYCIMTLGDYISGLKAPQLNQLFHNNDTRFEYIYHTSVELFIEIVESVNYLHKLKPSIILKDLIPDKIFITHEVIGRPENIILNEGTKDRSIRIADFGLKIRREFLKKSHTDYRSVKYFAPEVIIGNRKYDNKADIYSLGVICESLFNYDKDEITKRFKNKYELITKLKNQMIEEDPSTRPNCEEILNILFRCTSSIIDLQYNSDFEFIIYYQSDCLEICKYFIYYFIQREYYLLKNNIRNEEKEDEITLKAILNSTDVNKIDKRIYKSEGNEDAENDADGSNVAKFLKNVHQKNIKGKFQRQNYFLAKSS